MFKKLPFLGLMAIALIHSITSFASDEEIVKKIKKDKDYCSPLEKAQGRCSGDSQDKEVSKSDRDVVDKIKKRKDYCSPMDKFLKKC